MSKKIFVLDIILALLIFSGVYLMKMYVPQFFKNAFLSNIPFAKNFRQEIFKTYTSITDIKDEMKLVTAKQQFDFINIMDGKDGRYLEIATYEVRAGVDLKNAESVRAEIFSSDKINSIVVRKEAEISSTVYSECIRPVNIAYEQKARDYSVELGILSKARENAEETLESLLGKKVVVSAGEYKKSVPLSFVPLQLEVSGEYLRKNHVQIVPREENVFFRDALVLEDGMNESWRIRFGDSGRFFSGTFDDFYKSVFDMNTAGDSDGRDNVQVFRYFDPLYPKESEIVSYASDRYRTFFVLNGGRIYYASAECRSEQTLLDSVSPMMIYFASSLRKVTDRKIERQAEYQAYIEKFYDAAQSLRSNESAAVFSQKVGRLLESSASSGTEMTADEKMLKSVCDIRMLSGAENSSEVAVCQTGDEELDRINLLFRGLKVGKDSFMTEESRENALQASLELSGRIKKSQRVSLALNQYLESWFLQNAGNFSLSSESRQRYEEDLNSSSIIIASRPLIALKTDAQRNEYYFNLFRNRLAMSHFFSDTAQRIDDVLKISVRQNLSFAYFNIPQAVSMSDNDVYEKLVAMNGGHEIDNAFVLVFCQREWDFGDFARDDDIHALVLDDATLRLFLNIGAQNAGEKMAESLSFVARKFLGKNNAPEYFFFGDWKKLRITPDEVVVAGLSLGTKKITKRGRREYKGSNDYAEKSAIAAVLEDLQHAYSYDDSDFYYDTLCALVEEQVQRIVYEAVFRPSPRILEDRRDDPMRRYNF